MFLLCLKHLTLLQLKMRTQINFSLFWLCFSLENNQFYHFVGTGAFLLSHLGQVTKVSFISKPDQTSPTPKLRTWDNPQISRGSHHLSWGPPRHLPPSFQSAPMTPITFLYKCKSDPVFPSLPILFRRTNTQVPHLADKIWTHWAHTLQDIFHFPLQVHFILLHPPVCTESSLVISCRAPSSSDLWCIWLRKLPWWLSR